MSFSSQNKEIVEVCKKLLLEGAVDTVIGFKDGGIDGMAVPAIVTDAAECDNLVWNDRCVPNIASYLINRPGKAAIVAKPCDVRAVVNLILENQIDRDRVHIIGVSCPGMKDEGGSELHGCQDCRVNIPPVFDTHIQDSDIKQKEGAKEAADKLALTLERLQGELEKCILCFSCRQACYGCYCQTCFMDRGVPNWQPAKPDMGAKMLYHLGRAMHLSGRCVECGACENACASGVDIRYLIKEVTNFIEDLYGYRTGLDFETESVMLTYKADDREVGFLGGDVHG